MTSGAAATVASDDTVVCPADGLFVDEFDGGVGLGLWFETRAGLAHNRIHPTTTTTTTIPRSEKKRKTDLEVKVGLLEAGARHGFLPGPLAPRPNLLAVGRLGQFDGHLALLLGHGGLGGRRGGGRGDAFGAVELLAGRRGEGPLRQAREPAGGSEVGVGHHLVCAINRGEQVRSRRQSVWLGRRADVSEVASLTDGLARPVL